MADQTNQYHRRSQRTFLLWCRRRSTAPGLHGGLARAPMGVGGGGGLVPCGRIACRRRCKHPHAHHRAYHTWSRPRHDHLPCSGLFDRSVSGTMAWLHRGLDNPQLFHGLCHVSAVVFR